MSRLRALPLLALLPCLTRCGDAPAGTDETSSTGEPTTTTGVSTSTGEAPTTTEPGTTQIDLTTGSDTTSGEPGTSGTSDDTGATDDTGDTDEFIYPEPDWQPGVPEDHGLGSEGLAAMAKVAEEADANCLVVTQGGVLVGEWYWNGFGPDTDQDNVYSVTKSITSALVGIAAERGEVDLDEPPGFAEWTGTESEPIVLRNLIRNDSGREWSFNSDYLQLGAQPDQTQYAIDLGQDKPVGTFWEYNNAAIQTVERALTTGIAGDLGDYAEAHLFSRIHMTSALGRDQQGHPLTYQGASASCRDLARFGYLYLRGGMWAGGEQVVPADWVAETLTPSTALNTAYGYLWWLNVDGHWVLPSVPLRDEGDGKLLPSAPEQVFLALGAFGQLVVVDPTTDVVWVRLGPTDLADGTGMGKLEDLWPAFAAAQLP